MMLMKLKELLLVGVLIYTVVGISPRKSRIKLENNVYSGLLIGVSEKVLPSQTFIDGIEKTLTLLSESLFNATKRRSFLGQVTIALPPTWDNFNLTNVTSTSDFVSATSKQTFDWANIIIDEPNPSFADAPYTKQLGECGQPGEYIHMTEKFVTDEQYREHAFGDIGKLLVREWGHLRWGLFDESGSSDESPTKLFYHGMDGSLHPTRCSAQIVGQPRDAVTGGMCEIGLKTDLPSDTCLFMPDRNQPAGVEGSIMFMHSLPQITEFCDDAPNTPEGIRHNFEAPNKHNAMCNGRSAWAVMREHEDFADDKNPSVADTVTKDVTPTFKYVVQRSKEIVFVIDVSTRDKVNKVAEIRQAVGNYILNQAELGSKIGLVAFAEKASQVAGLQLVKNDSDRLDLVSKLFNDSLVLKNVGSQARTSIGSGLSKAISLISGGGSGSLDNADSSLVVKEACEYYKTNQDFTFEHQDALRKLYPQLKTIKELRGLCQDDLISGGGSASGDKADSSLVVQEACEYYRINQDFTFEQQSALKKLYPHLQTFKEQTALCREDVRLW